MLVCHLSSTSINQKASVYENIPRSYEAAQKRATNESSIRKSQQCNGVRTLMSIMQAKNPQQLDKSPCPWRVISARIKRNELTVERAICTSTAQLPLGVAHLYYHLHPHITTSLQKAEMHILNLDFHVSYIVL